MKPQFRFHTHVQEFIFLISLGVFFGDLASIKQSETMTSDGYLSFVGGLCGQEQKHVVGSTI